MKTLDLSYFRSKNCFETNDGAKNALVLQTMHKYFDLSTNQVSTWKSKGLSNQILNLAGTVGDTILSKSVKPMHVIFSGKGSLYQQKNDIIAGGPILNI